MNKLEIIKKYIRVNEIGKAQNLIFKSITDSNISILEKREIIDLFVSLVPNRRSGLIVEMNSLLDNHTQLLTYFSQSIKNLPLEEEVAVKENGIEYIENIFLTLDLEKPVEGIKLSECLLDKKYYGNLKDKYMKNINKIYFSSSDKDKIGLSLDKTFASIDKKLTGLGAENNIYTYFIDEVMRDAEILIKHYAFDKVDYFIDSLAKCYLKGYFPYTWEGKYPEGYIKYLA